MSSELHIKVTLDVTTDTFQVETDINQELLKEMLGEIVRSMFGAGEDHAKANVQDVYMVDITIDLSDDGIRISSDCGNKGLETGIIAEALFRMNDDGTIS
jgi:hypothetical protein